MSTKQQNEFTVTVADLGEFRFRRRDMKVGFQILAEMARIAGDAPLNEDARLALVAYASLQKQIVSAPDGFSLDDLDPLDRDSFGAVLRVWAAMREHELAGKPVKTDAAAHAEDATDV